MLTYSHSCFRFYKQAFLYDVLGETNVLFRSDTNFSYRAVVLGIKKIQECKISTWRQLFVYSKNFSTFFYQILDTEETGMRPL